MTLEVLKQLTTQGCVIWQPTAADLECGTKEGVIWPSVTVKMNSTHCS